MVVESWRSLLLAALLLFAICLGMGYAGVARYDPRSTPGMPDAQDYLQLAAMQQLPPLAERAEHRPRLLVPALARTIEPLLHGRTGRVDAALVSLLLVNSLFCAGTALLIRHIAHRLFADRGVAWLAALLYLLDFAVPNMMLVARVDSAEAFFLTLCVASLIGGKAPQVLPICGVLGVVAKETFLPFSGTLVMVWFCVCRYQNKVDRRMLAYAASMVALACATLVLLWSAWYGELVLPDAILRHHDSESSIWAGLARELASHEFLYVFGWLMPLGALGIRSLPLPWTVAMLVTGIEVVLLGAWDDGRGNFARALFNVCGPGLCVAAAAVLCSVRPARPAPP